MTTPQLAPVQLEQLRDQLERRRATLRREVQTQLDGSDDDRVVGLRHRLEENDDWGVADGLAELDIAEVRHALSELAAVEAALGRIAEGGYGVCVDCDAAIAPARLVAHPTATRCITCQDRLERRTKGPPATAR
jgi:DnaK suppressor protein